MDRRNDKITKRIYVEGLTLELFFKIDFLTATLRACLYIQSVLHYRICTWLRKKFFCRHYTHKEFIFYNLVKTELLRNVQSVTFQGLVYQDNLEFQQKILYV